MKTTFILLSLLILTAVYSKASRSRNLFRYGLDTLMEADLELFKEIGVICGAYDSSNNARYKKDLNTSNIHLLTKEELRNAVRDCLRNNSELRDSSILERKMKDFNEKLNLSLFKKNNLLKKAMFRLKKESLSELKRIALTCDEYESGFAAEHRLKKDIRDLKKRDLLDEIKQCFERNTELVELLDLVVDDLREVVQEKELEAQVEEKFLN